MLNEEEKPKDDNTETAEWIVSKFAEYSKMMDEVGEYEEATPDTAEVLRLIVIQKVGYCNFGIMEVMAIVNARRSIGYSDFEIVEDLIRVQGPPS